MHPSQQNHVGTDDSLQIPTKFIPVSEIHTKGIPNTKIQNELFLLQQKKQMILPIILQKHIREEKKYIVMAGEQLIFFAQENNFASMPCFIISNIETDQQILLTILEKIYPYLHCLEEAYLYNYLLSSTSCTQEELSESIQVGRSTISRILKLTSLPQILQEDVLRYRLSVSLAKEFSTISNMSLCMKLYAQHQKHKFTVAQLREQIKKLDIKIQNHTPIKVYSLEEIQQQCVSFFQSPCYIKQDTRECTLEIKFDSLTDL
jgi:ParB/RepB/Spo0J family partition protein